VYDIVGHKLSEFSELQRIWEGARPWKPPLTVDNYADQFKSTLRSFELRVRFSLPATTRFGNAGFDLPLAAKNWAPLLAGDSQEKTYLVLVHVAYPASGDNWRYALNADNLRFEFNDVEAAYQFLSSRWATGAQTKK
jgi:hypothetical protein